MYNYVTDKKFISKMKGLCGDIMQNLCHQLKEDYDIGATFYMVGSGARNLIMQNGNEPIDLDYNLELVRWEYSNGRDIKENVMKALNKVLEEYNISACKDSTSAITTEKVYFTKGNKTEFSMDIAIVYRDKNDNTHRLIHNKNGFIGFDQYYWVQAPNSKHIREKAKKIKEFGMWEDVRKQYYNIKNRYLCYNDYNHSSFICYIEAVNNVYNVIQCNREYREKIKFFYTLYS